MPADSFRVDFARDAELDLYAIEEYWIRRGEGRRGAKYFRDLAATAMCELAKPDTARAGRIPRDIDAEGLRELIVFKRSYRIFYEIDEAGSRVNILRFWHAHRDAPLE